MSGERGKEKDFLKTRSLRGSKLVFVLVLKKKIFFLELRERTMRD